MKDSASPDKPPQGGKNGKHLKKSLGPVSDLEQHVHSDWWRNIFNSLYLKTDSDVVTDQNITRHEVSLFGTILNPGQGAKILDLCCGQGRHATEFARRGFKNVEGLDRSHYLIQKAKAVAKKEGLDVRFREGDARKLPFQSDSYDIVLILGNSFGYFETVQDDLRVLKEVYRVLKPWGKLLIDISDGEYLREHYQPRSWEWITKDAFVCRERSLSKDKQRLISRELINDVKEGIIADQFYAERLYTRESIADLLREAGISDAQIHGTLSPDSQRNQDLGMMEQRIIVTGTVRKNWTPVRRRAKEDFKHVAVVFGDPGKPDQLKPFAIFDDDDMYTVDQLKGALREIPGYRWTFLNNHDTLFQDLTKLKGKCDYVLNLCDEGFDNDARKELHVPAIFEILDIPYTGSNPQCLTYCYDKSLVRGVAKEMGIPVPEAFFIKPEDTTFELPFDFPVIVKPNFGDSSLGITQKSVAYSLEELLSAVSQVRDTIGYDKPILVEEFLTGKDLSVGIIGNPPNSYRMLPITEEDYSLLPEGLPKICGYEAKWHPDSPYWKIKSVPAGLPEETEKIIVEYCLKLAERLECRDYNRFDWRLDSKGDPRLLEVNPNPGWCWDGHLAKMAKIDEISYPQLLELILQAAEQRLGVLTAQQAKEELKEELADMAVK